MCVHNAITMLHQLFHQLLRVFLWTLVPVFWCVRYMFVCVCVYVWCKYCKYYTICVGKSMIWSCLESGTTCLTAVFAILYLSTYVLICWFIFICWPSYERFLVNIDRPGWQKADWKKSELFPCSFCQEQSLCCRLESSALLLEAFWCGSFLIQSSYIRQKWSIPSALDMDSACFSCGILVSWTLQGCSWSRTSQFKQWCSFLLVFYTNWQFCVILLTFHLPIQCQQCPSFPSSEFFICLLTICQVMMFFQRTIFAPSWRIFTYSYKCLLWSKEAVIWNITDVAAGWNSAEKFKTEL